jgi:hypothetical protein
VWPVGRNDRPPVDGLRLQQGALVQLFATLQLASFDAAIARHAPGVVAEITAAADRQDSSGSLRLHGHISGTVALVAKERGSF